ncbi:MAG: glycine zipper 2TM domain-containing protein [Rhodocyclaceae bacterium]|nr:glycine zipper 2TM domain-containing protein [Rhodocyclaceae bacterium]
MKHVLLAALATAVVALGGCASSMSGSAYSRDQARGEMSVRLGIVDSVRQVQIEGTKSPVGGLAGGALGGVAGSQMGKGSGSTVGAIVGAVAGGLAGSAVEEGVTRQAGLEITVRLENGQLIAVTQAADEAFQPGERVRVLSGRGATRVTH